MSHQEHQEHLCLLRRQILQALKMASPSPLTHDELIAGIPHLGDVGEREVAEEIENLQTAGYLINRGNASLPFYRLSPAGLGQHLKTAIPLDSFIWGRLAL